MSGFPSTIEVSAGGGGSSGGGLALIEAGSVESNVSSITIADIPDTYIGLKLYVSLKTDQAVQGGTLGLRVNSVSGAAYTTNYIEGYGTTENNTEVSGANEWRLWRGVQGTSANDTALAEVTIMRYAESLNVHGMIFQCGAKRASSDWAAVYGYGSAIVSAPITQLVMIPYLATNFTDGKWALYGLASS